ncbi:hypothetical protein ScPMuIL_012447 [Solemya velum]
MSSFDGAETCELVSLFILSQLRELNIDVGLYKDDGLAISPKTPRQTELIKNQICSIFTNNILKITIEANKSIVNFLDVTFKIASGMYKPYLKPNNTPMYVHTESNHPPTILKNIPESINRRIRNISATETDFNEALNIYKKFETGVDIIRSKFESANNRETAEKQRDKRKRTLNISWFNPPFSENVATNIGKEFFKLLVQSMTATQNVRECQKANENCLSEGYTDTSCKAQQLKCIVIYCNNKYASKWFKIPRRVLSKRLACYKKYLADLSPGVL